MKKLTFLAIVNLLALSLVNGVLSKAEQAFPPALVDQAVKRLVGTWEGDGPSDSRTQQHVVLELREDFTYTKRLDAIVDGRHYGGTHTGSWKSQGVKVWLSGDGNWPPYVQDLSLLRKIR